MHLTFDSVEEGEALSPARGTLSSRDCRVTIDVKGPLGGIITRDAPLFQGVMCVCRGKALGSIVD